MNMVRRGCSHFRSTALIREALRLHVAVPFSNSKSRKPDLMTRGVSMAVLLLFTWSAWPGVGSAQQGNVILDTNERLFCVLAAINAAGYDAGAESSTGNNTRTEIRAYLARQKIP